MKPITRALLLNLMLVPLAGFAADPPIAVAPPESCADIKWNGSFLARYPRAPAACRAVEVRAGVKYAKFVGKVSKIDPNFVEVAISDVADYPISTLAFEIGVGGRVTVGDTVEKVSELKMNDKLTFWVPEGQFGISPTLTDKPMRIIKPETMPGT